MCNRYTLYTPVNKIVDACRVEVIEPSAAAYTERYNLSPTNSGLVIFNDYRDSGKRTIGVKKWGLIPGWSKDKRLKYATFNATVENVLSSRVYGYPVKKQRSVIACSGYYEWLNGPDKVKYPVYIHRRDGEPIWIAGLWASNTYSDEQGTGCQQTTFTMMTTEPNGYLHPVHNRMVGILESQEEVDAWLDTEGVSAEEAIKIIEPDDRFPNFHEIGVTPVGRAVNNTRAPDDPRFIQGLVGDELDEVIATCQTWNKQSGQSLATLYRWSV